MLKNEYAEFITQEHLLQAWKEFLVGKRKKKDVQVFERYLEDNLFHLYTSLQNKSYRHGGYQSFYVHDPKQRHIHKAKVADRIVHHLLYTLLYHIFDKTFIYDSYSCRLNKGTHKAVTRLHSFVRHVSKNYTKPCWALKCDIKKFFASVDHSVLFELLEGKIQDKDILWLLQQIIDSFHTEKGKGIPLGNLTSQVFANIYMNELDQYVKHVLKIKYYIRYADDFIFLSENKSSLEELIPVIKKFVEEQLYLILHPNKIIFRKLDWGIDFLGYIILSHGVILPRTKTERRLFKKLYEKVHLYKNQEISDESLNQSLQSYLGYLSHGNTYKLSQELKNQVWFWVDE